MEPRPVHDGGHERGPGLPRALPGAEGRARQEASRGADHPQPVPEQHPLGLAERGGLPALALPRAPPRARLGRADRRGAPHGAAVAPLGRGHPPGRGGRALAGRALPRLRHRVGRPRRAAALRPRGTGRRAACASSSTPGPAAATTTPRGARSSRTRSASAPSGSPASRRSARPTRSGTSSPSAPTGTSGPQSAGEVERFAAAIRDWNAQPAPARAPRQRDARRLLPLDRRGGGQPLPARAARRPRPLLGSLAGHARRARDRRAPGGARDALGRGPRRARRRRRPRRGHARAERARRVELGDARRPRVERDGRREPEGERVPAPALGRRARRRRPRPGRAGLGGGRPHRLDRGRDALQPDRRRARGRRPLCDPAEPARPRGPRRGRPRPAQPARPRERAAGPLLRPAPPRGLLHDDAGPRLGGPARSDAPRRHAHEPRGPLLPAHRRPAHRRPREPRPQADRARAGRRRPAHPRPDRLLRREGSGGRGIRERGRDDRPGARPPPRLLPDRPRGDRPLRHALRARGPGGPRLPRAQAGGRRRGAARPRLPRRRPRRHRAPRHDRGRRPAPPRAGRRPREGRQHPALRDPGLRGRLGARRGRHRRDPGRVPPPERPRAPLVRGPRERPELQGGHEGPGRRDRLPLRLLAAGARRGLRRGGGVRVEPLGGDADRGGARPALPGAGPGALRGPRARDRPRPQAARRPGRPRHRPSTARDRRPKRTAHDRHRSLEASGAPRPPRAGAGRPADQGRTAARPDAALDLPAHGFAAVRLE